jgi:hypothetical protein
MLRDTSKLHQPLAKETVAVLAGVCVSITDDVGVGVGDGQMAVHPLQFLNIVVDIVSIGTENHASVTVFCDIFISVLKILTDQKPNLSVIPTDKCQDWRFV